MPKAIITAQVEDSANWELAYLETFLEQLDSPETAEAMAQDSVNRDSVKVYILDKEISL